MASTPDQANLAADPDNHFLWRMNSRRMEAECIRDNLLSAGGVLDQTRGGPDIDHERALTSDRRSLYLRNAAEKQAEFLQIFDGPDVNECYQRHTSVMPQQALALSNSQLALRMAHALAVRLMKESQGDGARFVESAFERVLARHPTADEREQCLQFLAVSTAPIQQDQTTRSAENLVMILMNHNDFVTVR